jgi:hypothetical protein
MPIASAALSMTPDPSTHTIGRSSGGAPAMLTFGANTTAPRAVPRPMAPATAPATISFRELMAPPSASQRFVTLRVGAEWTLSTC